MENKINGKIKNDQKIQSNEYGQIRQTEQIDKLLEKQYDAETRILESALLKAAGKESWDDFPQESEEKIQEGYDRLIARLKEKGEYRENPAESTKSENVIKTEEMSEKVFSKTAVFGAEIKESGRTEKADKTETEKIEEIQKVRERFNKCENEWNKTHRRLKPVAAVVAAAMITALLGMTAIADTESLYEPQKAYEVSLLEKK